MNKYFEKRLLSVFTDVNTHQMLVLWKDFLGATEFHFCAKNNPICQCLKEAKI